MTTFLISQLADRTGVPATTLRYYEELGLLSAQRTLAGYRRYDDSAVERLEFITSAKSVGLPLDEIRDLLTVWDSGACGDVRERMQTVVAARIEEALARAAELTAFASELRRVHGELQQPVSRSSCGPECGCTARADNTPRLRLPLRHR